MFPTRQEVAENRARKKCPKTRIYVPEWERCACLKCGGVARRIRGGPGEQRECVECGFQWWIQDGTLTFRLDCSLTNNGKLDITVPQGLLLVLWELELTEEMAGEGV